MQDEILTLLENKRSESSRITVISWSDYRELLINNEMLYIRAFSRASLNSRSIKRMIKARYGAVEQFGLSIADEAVQNSKGLYSMLISMQVSGF